MDRITTQEARRIACDWCRDEEECPLYKLFSTGSINRPGEMIGLLRDSIALVEELNNFDGEQEADVTELSSLIEWIEAVRAEGAGQAQSES
jgi:hypothetical protein